MSTYAPAPVAFERGEGMWLWDGDGNRYLDAVAGVAVCGLGHAHPAVAKAVCEQAGRLVHTSNLYRIPLQERLAERLTRAAGMDRVFFGNSGAEANEAAIKLARLYGHNKGVKNPAIVVMDNSFHGRTLATLTATGNRKVQAGFEPLVRGFTRVPYDDMAALQAVAKNEPDVVAVLVEPVQGEGGVRVPDAGYLAAIRELCDQRGWLMMVDEIQTGMCRTGHWFAVQKAGVSPDVITIAKALGNGVPIGACLARGAAAETFKPGNHGSTFGGNPLACAAALAVMETLEKEDYAAHATRMGDYLLSGLSQALDGIGCVKEVRGNGLMIGVELTRGCGELVGRALEKRLLINVTAEQVIRLLPPLIITTSEADLIINGLTDLIKAFDNGN